jgi:hypothetical protein
MRGKERFSVPLKAFDCNRALLALATPGAFSV